MNRFDRSPVTAIKRRPKRERLLTFGQNLEHCHASGILITGSPVEAGRLCVPALQGQILWRTDGTFPHSQRQLGALRLRDSEVAELDLAFKQKQVVGLDVAMSHALGMQKPQRF